MEPKVEKTSFVIAARSYMSESNTPRLAYIKKDSSFRGYDLQIIDENENLLHSERVLSPHEIELDQAAFCHVPEFSKLLLRIQYGLTATLVTIEKEAPFTIETLTHLPKGDVKQLRHNQWWLAFFATEDYRMSLFWMDLKNPGRIVRAKLDSNNKAPHLAMLGESRDTTCFYLVERHGKNYHLTWITPGGDARSLDLPSFRLNFFSCSEENILFMDSYKGLIVILSQDNQRRTGVATLKLLILEHKNMYDDPKVVRKVFIEDYRAPLGVSMSEHGFLMLECKSTLGWIDLQKRGESKGTDGYVDTQENHPKRFALFKGKQGDDVILIWSASITDGCMIASTFNAEGELIARHKTRFMITTRDEKFPTVPKIFQLGKTFFATMNNEDGGYARCFQLDI